MSFLRKVKTSTRFFFCAGLSTLILGAGLSILLLAAQPAHSQDVKKGGTYFMWDTLATLPPRDGKAHPGLAGVFSGVSNDALIIAGGANFPEAVPWKGGKKVWWNTTYVLEKTAAGYQWQATDVRLPKPVAYGISLSLPQGLLCIGGTNESGIASDVFLLYWNTQERALQYRHLGALPDGFQATGGAVVDDNVFVSGIQGRENAFISAAVGSLFSSAIRWETLPPCPGPPRKFPAYAAQHNGTSTAFYLFGGRSEAGDTAALLNDGYTFDALDKQWHRIAGIANENGEASTLMAAPALAYGANTIFIFGGDDGELFTGRQALQREMENAPAQKRDSLKRLLDQSFEDHPGFSRDIYAFNTVTNTFAPVGTLPSGAPVTTSAVLWDDQVVLPSGEIRPGVRTPEILVGKPIKQTGDFGFLNYTVLIVYLVLLVLLGVYFSFRQKTTTDYFKGGGRVPWWAAGLSVFGTALSAITFMAIPAKTYATDWSYFLYNMSVLLVTPVIVAFFIPFFRRLNVTTAYEYLEKRFNVIVRLFGSASFILFQTGRIAIVLYLPAIAVSLVTGVDIYVCIIIMGLLSLVYTLIGGIEAVIWTDVVQVFVLMGGTLLALIMIFTSLEGDMGSFLATASAHDKFNIVNLEFSLIEPTFWVVLIGGFFANLVSYSSDQALVQRYLTTKSESGAAKTAWTNAVLVIPASLLFFGVGTALYMFYLEHPQNLDPFATDLDAIFPWYIVTMLPDGVSGLLIAGLFSAAMSTLSSSMNSAATAITTDFYDRFTPAAAPRRSLRVAKASTFAVGFFGTVFAMWMSSADIASLWDQFSRILGLFTGGLGGLFVLGIISRQAHGTGAIIGLLASSVIQYFVSAYTDLHIFLYAGVGLVSCVVIGQLASLVISDRHNPEGRSLTIYNKLFGKREG